MEQSRILFPDKNGDWHKVVGIGMEEKEGVPNLYFFFTKNFFALVDSGPVRYLALAKEVARRESKKFSELHLRYPPDGRVHLQFKDEKGRVIKDIDPLYSQHEPLSALTPAKRIFTIIPKAINHYPLHRKKPTEFDWCLEYEEMPEFFIEQPVQLNFWIGRGLETELLSKAGAIQRIEMEETSKTFDRYVKVFQGQDKHYQVFVTVSRPKELVTFPSSMRLFLHPTGSLKLRRASKK